MLSDSSAVFSDERRDVIVVKAASHIAVDEVRRAPGDDFAPASCRERRIREPDLSLGDMIHQIPQFPLSRRKAFPVPIFGLLEPFTLVNRVFCIPVIDSQDTVMRARTR